MAFCKVVRREGNCKGSETSTFLMLASVEAVWLLCGPWAVAIFTLNDAPFRLNVPLPCVEAVNLGAKVRPRLTMF